MPGTSLDNICSFEELCRRTDWEQLREQKNLLVRLEQSFVRLTAEDEERVSGLLAFIDSIQDLAAHFYNISGVFPATGVFEMHAPDFRALGIAAYRAASDAFGYVGEDEGPSCETAYEFLVENPEIFNGGDQWPDMPQTPPEAFRAGWLAYFTVEETGRLSSLAADRQVGATDPKTEV